MAVFDIKFPHGFAGGRLGVDVLLAPGEGSLFARAIGGAGRRTGISARIRPSNLHDAGPIGTVASLHDVGPTPRVVGLVRVDAEEQAINEQDELRHWISQRLILSIDSPARLFFLAMDAETHPQLMLDWTTEQLDQYFQGSARALAEEVLPTWTPTKRAARELAVVEVGARLNASFDYLLGKRKARERMMAHQVPLYKEISEVFERLSRRWLQGRGDCFDHAFDRFGAGLLRQEFSPRHPQLQNSQHVACDTDSEAVFGFAELAFMILDAALPGSEARSDEVERMALFWKPHLNALVRIQEVFLARFDRARYAREWGTFGPPPTTLSADEAARIVVPISALGDDVVRLRDRTCVAIRSTTRHNMPSPAGCE